MLGITRQFRFAFGDDEGSEVTEFAGTVPSALMMMNSQIMGRATSAQGRVSPLLWILRKHRSTDDRLRAIFLACMSRLPTRTESTRWKPHLLRYNDTTGYEDMFWTLMNTSEFLFNH